MFKVSCVIPAYNEAPRIGKVLQVVCNHPKIDEVIVIDDGSKDNIKEVVQQFESVQLIVHNQNQGKSQAVVSGILQSKGDIIFLLDADLIGLTQKDVFELLNPVLLGQADISISLRKNSPWLFRKIGMDFISGERVFSKALILNYLNEIKKLPRFGLEVFLNGLIIQNKCKIKIVFWGNVISPWPHQKNGWVLGIKRFCGMIVDILKTISPFEVVRQIVKMSGLRVK